MNTAINQKQSVRRFVSAIVALFLAASLLLLSSCSLISQMIFLQSLSKQGYLTEYGKNAELEDLYDDTTEEKVDDLLSQMERLVKENDPKKTEELVLLYADLEKVFYILSDHCNLVYVSFCQAPSSASLAKEHERLSGVLTDFYARINGLYDDIYLSRHSDLFFSDWTDDEIEEALALSKTYTEEYAEVTKERDKYVQLYEQLDQDALSFKKKSSEYYYQIVKNNRQLALLADVADYPTYADSQIYGRDYTSAEIKSFCNYVKEYIVPLGEQLLADLSSSDDYFTLDCEFKKLCQQDVSFDLMKEKLTPYYNELGGDFADGFTAFDDLIFTAKDDDSLPVAFTAYQQRSGLPICYFGPEYQTLSTYVHEQGHYFAFYLSDASISSIDLCETHSQANEWLYLAYAERLYDEELYKELTSYYLLNQLLTITLSCCCDTFERAVYADESLKAEDYDDLFINCVRDLGAYTFLKDYMGSNLENYWHLAVISNSMYYLSYAVSLVPSIEFFLIAKERGFDHAAELYYDLCTVSADAPFHKTILDAGLSSPFKEEVFISIYQAFETEKNNVFRLI